MKKRELVQQGLKHLYNAEIAGRMGQKASFWKHIVALLDLLLIETIGGASNETQSKIDSHTP